MRVTFLAVLADDAAVVVLVLTQEPLRVVVAVDVDLGKRVVCRRLHAPLVYPRLQPWQQQLEPVSFLHLGYELVRRELALDDENELLDGILTTVDIQQTTHDHRQTRRVHLHQKNNRWSRNFDKRLHRMSCH